MKMKQQITLFRSIVLFAVTAIFIGACQNDTKLSSKKSKPSVKPEDSSFEGKRPELKVPVFGDEKLEKEPFDMYHCYPLSSMYIFEYPVGNKYFDNLWKRYKTDPSAKVSLEKDVCIGDYCQSYEKLTHWSDKVKIFFFKGEAGEYGFDNAQYVFRNDSILFVRKFNVDIKEFSSDSTQTVWGITETITRFDPKSGKVEVEEKETQSDDLSAFDYSLKQLSATKSKRSYASWRKEVDEDIKSNVGMKKRAEEYDKL